MTRSLLTNAVAMADCNTNWDAQWFVQSLLQSHAVNILAGPPKSRKSTFRAHLLACAMTGMPVAGEWPTKAKVENPVILLGEEHKDAEATRMSRAFAGIGHDSRRHRVRIVEPVGWRLDQPYATERLREELIREGVDLVILDALVYFHVQDENSASGMSYVMAQLISLKDASTVLAVHHSGKATINADALTGGVGQHMRGSSVVHGAYDNGMLLRSHRDEYELRVEPRYGKIVEPTRLMVEETIHSVTGTAVSWVSRGLMGCSSEVMAKVMVGGAWTVAGLSEQLGKGEPAVQEALDMLTDQGLLKVEVVNHVRRWRRS